MSHPKRVITRDVRTRNPKRPARARRELEESSWPEGVVRVRDVSVRPDTFLREAARVIHENKIAAVPVVEHGRVVGMLAVGDVLKTVIQMLDEGVISQPGRWGAEA